MNLEIEYNNYDKYIHQILYYVGHAYRVIKYFDSSAF